MTYSKFARITTSCHEYGHPYTDSCLDATAGVFLHAIQASFRIYVTAYVLALLMKGRKPSKKDVKQTILGIFQSTAFLTCHAFGYSLCVCGIRKLFGGYNFLTASFVPSFVSSICAILVERPSRRGLLSLYVTNVASETLFHMAVWRKWIKPVKYGEVVIFSLSISVLLFFYKGQHNINDPIYKLLRLFVGPCEEQGYEKLELPVQESNEQGTDTGILRIPYKLLDYIKKLSFHQSCLHQNSCLYYGLHGGARLFAVGYGLQLCLKLLLQFKRILYRPQLIFRYMFHRDTFNFGAFFGGFGALYRILSCLLRRVQGKDAQINAIPAGIVAGLSFFFYRDITVALYVMWKALQIIYEAGADKGMVPEFPGANVFCHAFATAILFHAAILEPHNVRPSYWKFLHAVSGGRIAMMDRNCLDVFGLESTNSLFMAEQERLKYSLLSVHPKANAKAL